MKTEGKYIPALNEPPIGYSTKINYNSKIVDGKTFVTRGYIGNETYAIVYEPNTRPHTKISVFKVNE